MKTMAWCLYGLNSSLYSFKCSLAQDENFSEELLMSNSYKFVIRMIQFEDLLSGLILHVIEEFNKESLHSYFG